MDNSVIRRHQAKKNLVHKDESTMVYMAMLLFCLSTARPDVLDKHAIFDQTRRVLIGLGLLSFHYALISYQGKWFDTGLHILVLRSKVWWLLLSGVLHGISLPKIGY